MKLCGVVLTLVVTVAASPLPTGEVDVAFLARNLTAVWEEVAELRHELNTHLHGGHTDPQHDQVEAEVKALRHEHQVHHQHHPHQGHNLHHHAHLLQHLEDFHGHGSSHVGGGQHGEGQDHGSSEGHDHGSSEDQDHDSSDEEESLTPNHKVKHDDHHGHHGHHDHHGDEHGRDVHDDHGLHSDEDHHHGSHASLPARIGLAPVPGREGPAQDTWVHASCNLQPNADLPESAVAGTIIISQKEGEDMLHFDLDLHGFDVEKTGLLHGFHVHASPVSDQRCGTADGHFNLDGTTHGGPLDHVRHTGDLGNIEVSPDGRVKGHIVSDAVTSLHGPNGVVGKAIVVHEGEDDLGRGGDAGSLSTGNAGGRLACCNIHMQKQTRFRFKG